MLTKKHLLSMAIPYVCNTATTLHMVYMELDYMFSHSCIANFSSMFWFLFPAPS